MGPNEETVLKDLRVVAAVAEPPEVSPGEVVGLTVYVTDPAGEGVELAIWTCIGFGGECFETGAPLAQRVVVGAPEGGVFTAQIPVNPALAALLTETPVIPVGLRVLACKPGLCGLFEDLAAAQEPDADAALIERVNADLADTTPWMKELPLAGVNLATKSLLVSALPAPARNQNPVVVGPTDALVLDPDGIDVPFEVTDNPEQVVNVWGYTTEGGFEAAAEEVRDGEAVLRLFAAVEAGEDDGGDAEIYVVAEDGAGGAAVWKGSATPAP
jgi:hypothetical protein